MSWKVKVLAMMTSLLILSLAACAGAQPISEQDSAEVADEDNADPQEQQESAEGPPQATTGDGKSAAEGGVSLPAGFPASFPLPPGAVVLNDFSDPGSSEYQLMLSADGTLDEVDETYRGVLLDAGWEITDEEEIRAEGMSSLKLYLQGHGYEGDIHFIESEQGLGVQLFLLGVANEGDDLYYEYEGDVSVLGAGYSDLPPDLPLPAGLITVDLPAEITKQGYQAAFTSSEDAAEVFNMMQQVLIDSGWDLNSTSEQAAMGAYEIEFTDSTYTFEGTITILENPAEYDLMDTTETLIAIRPGPMDE
jgi:hypothetical protein